MEPSPRYLASWPNQSTTTPSPTQRASYRPKEISAMHGLAERTVYEALYRGELKGHQVGRAWVVAAEDVERWVRGGEVR